MNAKANIIDAEQARSHFPKVLNRVEAGEQFTITRQGAPVARLIPVQPIASPNNRRAVIEAMRELAGRNRLEEVRIQDLVAEGRK